MFERALYNGIRDDILVKNKLLMPTQVLKSFDKYLERQSCYNFKIRPTLTLSSSSRFWRQFVLCVTINGNARTLH